MEILRTVFFVKKFQDICELLSFNGIKLGPKKNILMFFFSEV